MADGKSNRTARRLSSRLAPTGVLRLVALALPALLSGCSLIGLGVGAGIDATRSRAPTHLTPDGAADLRVGSALTLVMVDSSTITGVLLASQFHEELRLAHLRAGRFATLDTLLVPLDRVAYAQSLRPRHAARRGFKIGLTVDLAIAAIVALVTVGVLLILLMLSQSGFTLG